MGLFCSLPLSGSSTHQTQPPSPDSSFREPPSPTPGWGTDAGLVSQSPREWFRMDTQTQPGRGESGDPNHWQKDSLFLHWDGSADGLEGGEDGGHAYHHSGRICPPARLSTRRAIKEEGRARQEMEQKGSELGQSCV